MRCSWAVPCSFGGQRRDGGLWRECGVTTRCGCSSMVKATERSAGPTRARSGCVASVFVPRSSSASSRVPAARRRQRLSGWARQPSCTPQCASSTRRVHERSDASDWVCAPILDTHTVLTNRTRSAKRCRRPSAHDRAVQDAPATPNTQTKSSKPGKEAQGVGARIWSNTGSRGCERAERATVVTGGGAQGPVRQSPCTRRRTAAAARRDEGKTQPRRDEWPRKRDGDGRRLLRPLARRAARQSRRLSRCSPP